MSRIYDILYNNLLYLCAICYRIFIKSIKANELNVTTRRIVFHLRSCHWNDKLSLRSHSQRDILLMNFFDMLVSHIDIL